VQKGFFTIMKKLLLIIIPLLSLLISCDSKEVEVGAIAILSINIDGNEISSKQVEVGLNPEISFTFDGSLSKEEFENAVSFQGSAQTPEYNLSYSNSNSKATFNFVLEENSTYSFAIDRTNIGSQGQVLSEAVNLELKTSGEVTAVCTSSSNPCLRTYEIQINDADYSLSYYSNYSLSENVNLENIKNAVVLIHGANRNNDDYFNWMNNSFEELDISSSTLLIAPQFKASEEISNDNELYWDSNNWREGGNAVNASSLSSFTMIDSLIMLASSNIPSIEKVMITGHSSGGLFTQVYGAANLIENDLAAITFKYLVANSQYFYYPGDERVNESTNELFIPSDCNSYDFWPLGSNIMPSYVDNIDLSILNDQFVNRNIHYLLGNGDQNDPSLNTSDCGPVLLGSSRYKRGENIYFYMQEKYPSNNHQRTIVEGIGHNGEAMYQSDEFKDLLIEVF